MSATQNRWIGITIDCAGDAGTMARFYEGMLGFQIRELGPRWAQLFDPNGGVHINIGARPWYQPPTWPESPGEQTKMFHFEVQVENLEAAVARAVELGGSEAPWQPPDRNHDRIRVMLDPAGHPICLFLHGE
jgi:catechol-2,3-dioxygenase